MTDEEEATTEEATTEIAVPDGMSMDLTDAPITPKTLQMLQLTPTVPKRYQSSPTGWQDMLSAVLVGREIGIGPMESIHSLYLVNGQVAMTGKLMSGMVHRAGHQIRLQTAQDSITAIGFRRDYVTHELTEVGQWTFGREDAERAGLDAKDTYQSYPHTMWMWRAVSMLCRIFFPDVISGMAAYVPEELGIPVDKIERMPDDIQLVDENDELGLDAAALDVVDVMDAEIVETE